MNGCDEEDAINYNPNVNNNDGSCLPIILGCTDNQSFNFDFEANTDDGSCQTPVILGCMDPSV